MAAALIGLHADFMIAMTGTPYNNGLQDIATLMAFIQPSHKSAYEKWWKKATKNGSAAMVVKAVESWSKAFIIRRGKDVIAHLLKDKVIQKESVRSFALELDV
jgi:SNF2 family DNA or RNA helicase